MAVSSDIKGPSISRNFIRISFQWFVSSELVGTRFVSSELVDSKTGPGDAGHVFAGIVRGPRDRWDWFIYM